MYPQNCTSVPVLEHLSYIRTFSLKNTYIKRHAGEGGFKLLQLISLFLIYSDQFEDHWKEHKIGYFSW